MVIAIVDGNDAPVPGAILTIDGVEQSPRDPGGHEFELERSLVGHALDVRRDGFLVHQNLVPDRDLGLDLFAVPASASKTWLRNLLYDGVVNESGTLARLQREVSIVRGASFDPEAWVRARPTWEQAARRMTDVTGYSFQLAESPLPGSTVYTVELDPTLAYGGYFRWFGSRNRIERGTVSFRTTELLRDFSLVLHELTHGFGLSHSDFRADVMHPSAVSENHQPRELSVVAAVKRRPPGTAWEDNVRDATGALGGMESRGHFCGSR